MCPADLPHADTLRQIAGWNQRPADWQRFLDLSPHGCFVAETAGQILGTVTTIQYARQVAWIGMLLVHPDSRGNGIGKALLTRAIEHLQSEKIPSIKLDATPLGEPLYRKLGFKEEWRLTRFKGTAAPTEHISKLAAREPHEEHLDHAAALDRLAFGAARGELIRSLASAAERARIVTGIHDAIDAFGLWRTGSSAAYLGPVVVRNAQTATTLIADLIENAPPRRSFYWDVPEPNQPAVALAKKLGLQPERELLRMYFGRNDHPGDVSKYFAIADPSLG